MKNKKGFTLIELLAVIVILAVIMVIAVPKILDIIENSRKRAFENSYKLVTSAIKNQLASSNLIGTNFEKSDDGCYEFDFTNKNNNVQNLKVKNKETFTGSISYCDNKISYNELSNGSYTISEDIVYKNDVEVCEYEIGKEWIFDYTGNEQNFEVPCKGIYKLETWGAQGGGSVSGDTRGGYGAYSVGAIKLIKNETLYINVGGTGTLSQAGNVGGYNGGGTREHITSSDSYLGTGGGATHIATVSGLLSELEEYKGIYNEKNGTYNSSKILIVSGGGGGGYLYDVLYYGYGGDAGGITGGKGYSYRNGIEYYTISSTQNSGYLFGKGINGEIYTSGGGAGWYGGLSIENNSGGGSSFIGSSRLISYGNINKSTYCYSCEESSLEDTRTISTSNISVDPISAYVKQKNGYAKITLISY